MGDTAPSNHLARGPAHDENQSIIATYFFPVATADSSDCLRAGGEGMRRGLGGWLLTRF